MYPEKLELLINGQWRQGSEGKSEPLLNPATEEVIGQLPHASTADLDEALQASERGFKEWRVVTPLQRQAIMEKAARLMEERLEDIAVTLTMEEGKPIAEARLEAKSAVDVTRWYAEEGKRTYGRLIPARVPGIRQSVIKEPVGPTCGFAAWNFPASNVIKKIAGALGAGCSAIVKPSEETPGTAIALARCFQDAGLPKGVLNIVFGKPAEVSSHLLASWIPRKVSFTGSTSVGKHLLKLSAETVKRCTMELGGHSPVIVFDDADVDSAVKQLIAFKYRNAGQVCTSPTRFYVQQDAYRKFVDGFTEIAKSLKVGNGLHDGTQMGPLIGSRRIDVMNDFIADAVSKGGKLRAGGARVGNQGFFFAPTVIADVPDTARIMREEPFGPVVPMTPFKSIDEVMERANSLPYGLASYVFTSDTRKAARVQNELEAGMVGVNQLAISIPETPFGGINESGYGSEGGIEGLDAFLRTKFVAEIVG